jgi:hypothetical protein
MPMSLDVSLIVSNAVKRGGTGIFIREDGRNREVTWDEWNERFPGREPVVVQLEGETNEVFDWNITHNLGKMADEAGLYDCMWRPDEHGITKASQLIEPLRAGLATLKADPARFEQFNPANGWGDYDGLVRTVEAYLKACEEYPDAEVSVSR